MARLPIIVALAGTCGLTPLSAGAGVGVEEPYGAVRPLARAELADVRGGFKIGAFDMNIGVTVQTSVNRELALSSTFVVEGLDRLRQIGDTVGNGLSSLNETLGTTATVAAAASSGRATPAAPTTTSSASPTPGGAASNTQPSSATSQPAQAGAGGATPAPSASSVALAPRTASAPVPAPSNSGSTVPSGTTSVSKSTADASNAQPASIAVDGGTAVPGSISIPGLTVSHALNGLPRSVVLNRLNNVSISQQVRINLTLNNFRDLVGAFRAGRMAADAARSALALRGL